MPTSRISQLDSECHAISLHCCCLFFYFFFPSLFCSFLISVLWIFSVLRSLNSMDKRKRRKRREYQLGDFGWMWPICSPICIIHVLASHHFFVFIETLKAIVWAILPIQLSKAAIWSKSLIWIIWTLHHVFVQSFVPAFRFCSAGIC